MEIPEYTLVFSTKLNLFSRKSFVRKEPIWSPFELPVTQQPQLAAAKVGAMNDFQTINEKKNIQNIFKIFLFHYADKYKTNAVIA